MTNEEAIKKIKSLCHDCVKFPHCVNTDPDCFKALEIAIKVLSAEPCEDAISREELLKAIDTWDRFGVDDTNSLFRLDNLSLPHYVSYIHYDDVIKCIKGMPSVQPTVKENLVVGDCISKEFIEIVVKYPPADLCTYPEYKRKPYFSIKYRENGKEYVGFGTYKIEMLSQWIKEYFMPSIQPKLKTDEPMQVELEGDGYADGKLVYDYGKCPKCGWDFEYGDKDWEEPYCCHCGQKLHWFESEEQE